MFYSSYKTAVKFHQDFLQFYQQVPPAGTSPWKTIKATEEILLDTYSIMTFNLNILLEFLTYFFCNFLQKFRNLHEVLNGVSHASKSSMQVPSKNSSSTSPRFFKTYSMEYGENLPVIYFGNFPVFYTKKHCESVSSVVVSETFLRIRSVVPPRFLYEILSFF